MELIFVLLVVLGFAAHFAATFPINYTTRIGWGLWLAAAMIWAIQTVGIR